MKKFALAAILIAGALLLIWGCSSNNDNGGNPPTVRYGTVSGAITLGSRAQVTGAQVTVGDLSTNANEQGYFVLSNVPVGDHQLVVALDGYLTFQRGITVIEGQTTHLTDVYLPTAETVAVASSTGGTAATGDGDGTVTFAPNSFRTASGSAYNGDVSVEVTAMMPSDDNFYDAFPGDFEGIREDGTTVQFVSFGFMGVNLFSADKSTPLQLADGETATLSLAVGTTFAKRAPATVPMWYFDETTGVWREQGEATLVGDRYEASVSHFTTWNWDMPITDVCQIRGQVLNTAEEPVELALVYSQCREYAIMDRAYTDAYGYFTVRGLKNACHDVWALKGSFASTPVEKCLGEACPDTIHDPLVLLEPAYSITLTWGGTPSDLDSHLLIPMTWDTGYDYYHICYYSMGTLATDPYTMLDTDDTSSYGPEIISSAHYYQGTYQYWVFNFSSQGEPEGSQVLHDSGAVVRLEAGGTIRSYRATDVPLNGADTTGWWHVFDLTYAPGSGIDVTSVMQFQPVFSNVGVYEDKSLGTTK